VEQGLVKTICFPKTPVLVYMGRKFDQIRRSQTVDIFIIIALNYVEPKQLIKFK